MLLTTSYCTSSPSVFTPAAQVALGTLKIGVQNQDSSAGVEQTMVSSIPVVFWCWNSPGDKKQVWGALPGMSVGHSIWRRHFSALRTARGRFWSLQLMSALASLDSVKEHRRRTSSTEHPSAASSIRPFSSPLTLQQPPGPCCSWKCAGCISRTSGWLLFGW